MNSFKLFLISIALLTGASAYSQSADFDEIIDNGIALYDKGDYQGALKLYKLAQKIDTVSGTLNYEMASTYYALKDTENALRYCEKSIQSNYKYNELAYVLYGTILDGTGNSAAAIAKYKEGLTVYPKSYLLYYNLALTNFNNFNDKEAAEDAKKALLINPQHAGSHLVMAYIMLAQKKRIPCIFALYNFLLLEPKGKKAEAAYKELNKQLGYGVTKNDSSKTTISLPGTNDEFSSLELALGMLEASKTTAENKNKMEEVLFYENTKTFFAIADEIPKSKNSFWTKFYIDYFAAMNKSNLIEPFCYYISQTKYDEDVSIWLRNNQQKVADLKRWLGSYVRKY